MHLRKVSTHVSRRSPRRLTRVDTFRNGSINEPKLFAIFQFSARQRSILLHDLVSCLTKQILWTPKKAMISLV